MPSRQWSSKRLPTTESPSAQDTKLHGPVPTGLRSTFASGSSFSAAGETIIPARSDRISGSAVSGCERCSVTSCPPVASTDSTFARSCLRFEISAVRLRSRLKTTASASKGSPSWKVTPSRSFRTSVCGSVNSQLSARPGSGASVSKSQSTSVS